MEEKKHVCKHCNKRFACGKSLGGHIRIHMMNEHYSVNANEERNNATNMLKRKRELGSCSSVGEDGNLVYGLRENPKKTIRFVHSSVNVNYVNNNNNSQMENFCKECGKGFTSLKALCGHMACHSEKEQKLVHSDTDTDTDTDTSLPMKSTTFKRIKFKTLSSSNNNNCYKSLPVSEVDNEKEEGAKCLMILSNDKRPFTLVIDSSENDAVLLEEISPSPMNYGVIVEEEKLKHKDVKYYDSDYDSDNSDSGYFLYGPKKLDSAADDEVNSSKGYFEYLDNDKRFNDSRKRLRPNNDSLAQNLVGGCNKRAKNGENNEHDDDSAYESDEKSSDSDAEKTNNSSKNVNGKVKKYCKKGKKKVKSKKSKEHECPICNKIFKSGQALGGHKRSHFIGGGNEENNNTLLITPNPPPPPPPPRAPAPTAVAPAPPLLASVAASPPARTSLIDLNLPAPDDE